MFPMFYVSYVNVYLMSALTALFMKLIVECITIGCSIFKEFRYTPLFGNSATGAIVH